MLPLKIISPLVFTASSFLTLIVSIFICYDIWGDITKVLLLTTFLYTCLIISYFKFLNFKLFSLANKLIIFYIFLLSLVCLPNIITTADDGVKFNILDSLFSLILNLVAIIFIFLASKKQESK